jgi:hypothetical protein
LLTIRELATWWAAYKAAAACSIADGSFFLPTWLRRLPLASSAHSSSAAPRLVAIWCCSCLAVTYAASYPRRLRRVELGGGGEVEEVVVVVEVDHAAW